MTETQPGVPLILDVSGPATPPATTPGFTGVSPDTSTYTLPCLTPNPAGDDSGDACMTDELTFLRGFVLTDSSGVAEMATVFPGFYTGRTPHIHVTVHTGGSVGRDGTYVGGGLRHVGQLYPGDDAATAVYALVGSPYYARAKAAAFVRLADDAFAAGDSLHRGVLNLTRLGGAAASVGGGLIGAVTVFVDTKANMSDPSANRYDSRASWIGTEVATGRLTATSSSASSSATNRNSTSGSARSFSYFETESRPGKDYRPGSNDKDDV
ncbi:hypothetical protein DFJ73DRAFT_765519 [Zopfochytrium polystomum]|nr:hypothetical protein DFJ73DRAFT_765519 [Zopfochytrium polystomum]